MVMFRYSKDDKRTDYQEKKIAKKVQFEWDQNFDEPIAFVIGDEWKAGNLILSFRDKTKMGGFY